MNADPHTISTMVFVAVLAGIGSVLLMVQAGRMKARAQLRRRLGELKASEVDGLIRGGDGEARASNLAQLLVESGLGWNLSTFVSRSMLAAATGLLLGVCLGSGFLAVVLAAAGPLAMLIFVRRARVKRLRQCDDQMPQALEIMAMALRAGHALPSALSLAADESPAPLSHELRRAADEHALGRPVTEVLQALGDRLPGCDAVNTFVVAVLVLQETGGNLIAVIDRIVENARARANYQARLRALTAEGRSSAKLLALLPGAFAILAGISDPSYAQMILHDDGGRMIALVSAGLWAVGLLWTRRLVRVLN